MTLRYWKDAKYRKVGRLYPGDDDLIHIVYDGIGELGTMTIEQAENILAGIEPQTISPAGSSDLSIPGTGYKMTIPANGMLYLAIAKQVRNMLDKWPRRKSALWLPDAGTEILESVFIITGITDCHHIIDINREWAADEIIGKIMRIYVGDEIVDFIIAGYSNHEYLIIRNFQATIFDNWTYNGRVPTLTPYLADLSYGIQGDRCQKYGPVTITGPSISLLGISEIRFSFKYYSKMYCEQTSKISSIRYGVNPDYAWNIPGLVEFGSGYSRYKSNIDYPIFVRSNFTS